MKNRTPSIDDLAKLSRDEWDELAAALCSTLYRAHRVEDKHGKGNGLDAWREMADGTIQGWQFKRYDGRFGSPQEAELQKGLELAVTRIKNEHRSSLSRFTAIFNIDAEPGHKGSLGEIERLKNLTDWAKQNHQVIFTFLGVTWVRARLLSLPALRPDLFEDMPRAISDAQEETRRGLSDINRRILELAASPEVQAQLGSAISVLLREASTHFDRGNLLQLTGAYSQALTSLGDAVRLTQATKNTILTGKIFALLAGVETMVGYFKIAIDHGRQAVQLLGNGNDEFALLAKGNLAFSLQSDQQYNEADGFYLQLLDTYEMQGNFTEVLRTLTHMTEGYTQRRMLEKALFYSERMRKLAADLEYHHGGPTQLTLLAKGAEANVLSMMSTITEGALPQSHVHAIETFRGIEAAALKTGDKHLRIAAKAGQARALWNLNDLYGAAALYREVAKEAPPDLLKISGDALFNLGLVLEEALHVADAQRSLEEARSVYKNIEDKNSFDDAEQALARVRGKR